MLLDVSSRGTCQRMSLAEALEVRARNALQARNAFKISLAEALALAEADRARMLQEGTEETDLSRSPRF